MESINWGIIGCGGIAEKFARSLGTLETGTLLAGASRTPGKAAEFAQKFDMPRVYDNYESLVADPDVDAVYVATTHNFHHENIRLCLENGKHVLCEKPFTVNAAQAEEMIQLARSNNLFLMEGFWTRFLPAIRKMQELLAAGVIGEVRTVHAHFCIGASSYDNAHRIKNKALAGGALLDLGVYPINLAAVVFGEHPETIESSVVMGETDVDYSSFYHFTYPGGRRAELSSSIIDFGPNDAVVLGTKGYIRLPSNFHGSAELTVQIKGEEPQTYAYEQDPRTSFRFEIQHAMECISAQKTESDIMPHSETLAVMKTMDALRAQWDLKYDGE